MPHNVICSLCPDPQVNCGGGITFFTWLVPNNGDGFGVDREGWNLVYGCVFADVLACAWMSVRTEYNMRVCVC